MRQSAVVGAGLAVFLAVAPAYAQDGALVAAAPTAQGGAGLVDNFMWYRVEPLNSTPSIGRYLLNECVIAGVGAMAVTAILTGPVAPTVVAAVGAAPGLTMLEVGAIGCGGGVAAGVASASVVWAWEEQDYIRDVAETQIAGIIDQYGQVSAAVGSGVAQVWSDPVGSVQATVVAFADGAAALMGQGGEAAGAAMQMASAAVSGWWTGQNRVDDFVTFETASMVGRRDGEIMIH